MLGNTVNYAYIFLESMFWGYTIWTLPLLIIFLAVQKPFFAHETLNWLSAMNICFVSAMIATLYPLIFFIAVFISYICLDVFGQLPNTSPRFKWKRGKIHVQ
jgi:hypothetical protein